MTNLFFKNPRLLTVTLALILVAGLAAFRTLPRTEDPRFANRFGVVVTRLPGANAERVEALVTDPIENKLRDVQEIREVLSQSRTGVSVLTVELEESVGFGKVDEVWSRIRDKIDDAKPDLPADASDPNFDNDQTYAYTMIWALVWDEEENGSPANMNILRRQAEVLEDRLRRGARHRVYACIRGAAGRGSRDSVAATPGVSGDHARGALAADCGCGCGRSVRASCAAVIAVPSFEVTGEVEDIDRIRNVLISHRGGGPIRKARRHRGRAEDYGRSASRVGCELTAGPASPLVPGLRPICGSTNGPPRRVMPLICTTPTYPPG